LPPSVGIASPAEVSASFRSAMVAPASMWKTRLLPPPETAHGARNALLVTYVTGLLSRARLTIQSGDQAMFSNAQPLPMTWSW
jgi:hypothetical protein